MTPSPNPLVNLASTQLRIGRFFELVPILSCNSFIIFSHINLKLLCNQVANLLQPFLNVSDVHCVPLRNTRFTIYWEQSSSSTIFYSQTSTTSPSQHTSVANQNCQQSLAATPTTNPLTTTLWSDILPATLPGWLLLCSFPRTCVSYSLFTSNSISAARSLSRNRATGSSRICLVLELDSFQLFLKEQVCQLLPWL